MKYLKLIRVEQWIKNAFVFVPLFFSGNLFNYHLLFLSIIGFVVFCLAASSIYILNDYMDLENDRNHPSKKNRPLASGAVKVSEAFTIFFILIILAAILLFIWGNWKVITIISFYFLMNIGYSLGLKKIAILDVAIISIGFLLRVLLGGYITGIMISSWTILLTFSIALIMALGKRRGELKNAELTGVTRKSLDGYNIDFLNVALGSVCAITIVCYVMYIQTPETQQRLHHYVLYTFIFVFVGVLRYLQLTFVFEKTESPTKMVYKDLFLQIVLILWSVSYLLLIYFK